MNAPTINQFTKLCVVYNEIFGVNIVDMEATPENFNRATMAIIVGEPLKDVKPDK